MSKYTKTMRDALAEMTEAFSTKQIKMAIGIASDKRYAGGNMTGAVKQIEKLKKGLSDHPQVAAVLKRQNEMYDSDTEHTKDPKSHVKLNKETGKYCVYDMKDKKVAEFDTKDEAEAYSIKNHDALMNEQQLNCGCGKTPCETYGSIDEGRMKELHGYIEKGMSAEEIAKKMKLDLKTIKALMKEEVELDENRAARDAKRAMSKDKDMQQRPFDKDDKASMIDTMKAKKNIVVQLKKATNLGGSKPIEFDSGPSKKIDPKFAKAALDKLNKIKKSDDRLKFQAKLSKSYKDMLQALKEDFKLVEAKFSDDMINKLKKAYEPMKGKKINPTPLMKIFDKIDSNKDGLEQLYKADIPFVSMMAMSRLMLKHNYKAADINKLGKIRREDFVLDEAINEMKEPFAVVDTADGNKVVGTASDEKGAKSIITSAELPPMKIKDKKTLKIMKSKKKQMIGQPFKEEVELDERKFEPAKSASGYDIFHKDFSSAMQHATAFAKKKGQPIKKDEIDNKVATGPKKPSSGKENSYTLETEKGKMWSVQVYNMGSKFELNMYLTSSHVPEGEELDEMKMNDPKLNKIFDKLKKGSKVKLKTSSTISQGKDYVEYIVKSKNTVNKGRVEKITLATVGNEKAVKKFLYKRDGQVTFAIGDMGASIDDIKESTNEVPENMAAYLAAITKQLGEK